MFEGKYFLFNLEKGIGVLTLNRPPLNIFEAGFYKELEIGRASCRERVC